MARIAKNTGIRSAAPVSAPDEIRLNCTAVPRVLQPETHTTTTVGYEIRVTTTSQLNTVDYLITNIPTPQELPVQIDSKTPELLQVVGNTAKSIGTGPGVLRVTSNRKTGRRYLLACQRDTTPVVTTRLQAYLNSCRAGQSENAITTLLHSVPENIYLFSAKNIRNIHCPINKISNVTALMSWSSRAENQAVWNKSQQNFIPITPDRQYAFSIGHFQGYADRGALSGLEVEWITQDNVTHRRTVIDSIHGKAPDQVTSALDATTIPDAVIIKLDTPLPASIGWMKFGDIMNWGATTYGAFYLVVEQNNRMGQIHHEGGSEIEDCEGRDNLHDGYETPNFTLGDSGSPILGILNHELVLCSQVSGHRIAHDLLPWINTTLATLECPNTATSV